jgi:hypothetical protein
MPDQDQESKDFQVWNAYQSLDGIIEMSYKDFYKLILELGEKNESTTIKHERIRKMP